MSPRVRCVYQILSPSIVTTRCVQKTNLGHSETRPTAPLHPQKPSGLARPACRRAGNAGSHKGSLYLDARNQKGRGKQEEEKKNSSGDTCTPCFGVAFHSLFAKFSKQNQRRTCACTPTQPPPSAPSLLRADLNPELHKKHFLRPRVYT